MKKAVFVTPMHCETTKATPKHQNCPEGKESWCFFQKALANNATPLPHATAIKNPLGDDVVSKIMPIYKRLGSEKLLSRSVDGKTLNANEVHGVLWSKCPKTTLVFRSTLLLRVSESTSTYNTGYIKTV